MKRQSWALAVVAVIGLAASGCSNGGGAAVAATARPSAPSVAPSPTSSSSPSLDAATQAYLAVISRDGQAYAGAHDAGAGPCKPGAPLSQQVGCGPAIAIPVAKSLMKLQADLAGVRPPARWARDDKAIREYLPKAIAAIEANAKAYDRNDDSAFRKSQSAYLAAAGWIQQALRDIDPQLNFV